MQKRLAAVWIVWGRSSIKSRFIPGIEHFTILWLHTRAGKLTMKVREYMGEEQTE